MKKLMLVSLLLLLTAILSLGGFANPAQASDRGNHRGLLMDPIKIEDGYISGTVFGDPDDPVRIYRGIPYAAPPVGDLRWKPPQPSAKWSGIRECVDYSIYPVQFLPGRYYPVDSPQSEDCLYLNVLTPARHDNEKLPVMVWFHGGGLWGASGNDVTWNFHRLPQHGVVVVTVNTRLGPLGLLAHPELTAESSNSASGNSMFLDQIAALQWVQRNISKFGGNPKNVTIFGQSGGGSKVVLLLASPLAKGLFHRAIMQSGGNNPVGVPLAISEAWGQEYFAKLGVATLAEARALPWKDLVDAFVAWGRDAQSNVETIDGWFLPDTVPNIFSSGHQNVVPLIVQAVSGELTPTSDMIPDFVNFLTSNLNVGTKGYAAIFNQLPANWEANGQQSFHALDLAYTFGVYDDPYADIWQQMTARTTLKVPPELGEQDQIVSEGMMTMWTQFAKTGDPNVPGKAKRSVYWPVWTPSGDKYLYLDEGLQINSGFSAVGK